MDETTARLGYAKPKHYAAPDDPDAMLEALRAVHEAPPAEREVFWTALRGALSKTTPELEAEHQRRKAARPVDLGIVYYIRFADRVKIGYTTNLRQRLHNLPHDEVLATEPGTLQDERARHVAFADLRVTGEWFRYEEPLVSHIAGL